MSTLGVIIFSIADNEGMRWILLVCVLVAVVLLLAASTIALMTLRNQRKSSLASIASNQLESE